MYHTDTDDIDDTLSNFIFEMQLKEGPVPYHFKGEQGQNAHKR